MTCGEDCGARSVKRRGRRAEERQTARRWRNKTRLLWCWTVRGYGHLSQRLCRFCVVVVCEPSGSVTEAKRTMLMFHSYQKDPRQRVSKATKFFKKKTKQKKRQRVVMFFFVCVNVIQSITIMKSKHTKSMYVVTLLLNTMKLLVCKTEGSNKCTKPTTAPNLQWDLFA